MVTPNQLSGPELDAQHTSGTVPSEIDPTTGKTVSGKTLTQSGENSAIQSGAIYNAAAQDLIDKNFSEIAGTSTLPEQPIS